MPKVIVTGKRHNRSGSDGKMQTFEKGETFEATDAELKKFADRLAPVAPKAPAPTAKKSSKKASK